MFDKLTSIKTIIRQLKELTKSQHDFLGYILGMFLSIKTRINFLQCTRHSDEYNEKSCRLQFERYVDFMAINSEYIRQKGSGRYVIAYDLSYLRKSGKSTDGTGKYWSGVAQKALWGLEVGLVSVIDIGNHTAFHLDAIQTPSRQERKSKEIDLPDHYAQSILYAKDTLEKLSNYLTVDAYFAKKDFIDRIQKQSNLAVITRLRCDANCQYLYHGPIRQGRGAPKKYDGKIDWNKPDLTHFKLSYQDQTIMVYDVLAYCMFLKRKIRIAFCQFLTHDYQVSSYKIYACTDLTLPALLIWQYYKARFQQEFLIRDAKQFTGLQDCQARSVNKLEYHWNTSLTAINIAKFEHWLDASKHQQQPFSMADVKTLYHNQLLIERFFTIFPEVAELTKNNPKIKELYAFGSIAA
jgi:hypothetical protein